jgi:hypothetical protein
LWRSGITGFLTSGGTFFLTSGGVFDLTSGGAFLLSWPIFSRVEYAAQA